MRLAILSDIHANVVALEAVLTELASERIDGYVYLGDVSLGGPQPRQALERVRDLGATFVRGNSDDELLELRPGLPWCRPTPPLMTCAPCSKATGHRCW